METEKKRVLSDGREFDHLFPHPGVTDTVIRKSADVADTMKLIRSKLPETIWQTEKIAKRLKGRTLEETCSNIWHFVYHHIQYKRDEDGVEQVRSPRRAWHDRKSGVDCDCYSVFILSILSALQIPCVARITKYAKRYPQVPRWQHVYPIVPKRGHEHDYEEDRNYYHVLDCVKDRFDDEQTYLECKDYDMRLDYLDGIEEDENEYSNKNTNAYMKLSDYDNVDLADISSVYDDEQEMNGLFKKIGNAVKSTVKNVGDKVGDAARKVGDKVGDAAKKVGDKVGDGIRILNRYTNPATILLRSGFLLAMKVNLLNVAGRLRYGYLTDAEANARNMNMNELQKVRQVKDRAETVYWQAGGKKENLRKAILKGKGNRDQKVPLSGLQGLPEVYADEQEYNIIHSNNIEGLGELVSGTALAAATSAVAAIAAALKQVKGLFNQGGGEEQAFQSETDNAGNESTAPANVSEEEDSFNYDEPAPSYTPPAYVPVVPTYAPVVSPPPEPVINQPVPQVVQPEQRTNTNETTANNQLPATTTQPVLPDEPVAPAASTITSVSVASDTTAAGRVAQQNETPEQKTGMIAKTTLWVRQNPGKSLLVAGGIVAGGIVLMKAMRSNPSSSALNGITTSSSKGKRKKKMHRRKKRKAPTTGSKNSIIRAQHLL